MAIDAFVRSRVRLVRMTIAAESPSAGTMMTSRIDWKVRRMIKGSRLPYSRCMTRIARYRVLRRHVIRVCRCGIVFLMTCVTIGRGASKSIVEVTASTCSLRVRSRQWKICLRMVERCRLPCNCRVACCTSVIETSADMVRVGDTGKISLMTAETIRAQSFELAVLVAEEAVGCEMRAGQWKRCCRVVERRWFP